MCGVLPIVSRIVGGLHMLLSLAPLAAKSGLVETGCKAQFGKPPRPQEHDLDRAYATSNDGRNRANDGAEKSRFGFASSFEAEMKRDDTAPTRPRMVSGV